MIHKRDLAGPESENPAPVLGNQPKERKGLAILMIFSLMIITKVIIRVIRVKIMLISITFNNNNHDNNNNDNDNDNNNNNNNNNYNNNNDNNNKNE